MKKYLVVIGIGALMISSACDSMNQESLAPVSAEEEFLAKGDPSGENLRRNFGNENQVINLTQRNYRLMENVYTMLPSYLPKEAATEYLRSSRGKEQFVETMIKKSIKIFDGNLLKNGRFLSLQAKQKHQALAQGEHEIEYDILAFGDDEEAAFGYYLKIPDIDGDSGDATAEEFSFNFAKIEYENTAGKCGAKDYLCNSAPSVTPYQLEEIVKFLKLVERFNGETSYIPPVFEDLIISSGITPVATGLLLPAVQKAAEGARIYARGKADILIESLSKGFEINLEDQKGRFLRYGGMGSIAELISEDYDDTGDLDWATIQLNRTKFELEMLLFWSRFWDENQTEPTSGR